MRDRLARSSPSAWPWVLTLALLAGACGAGPGGGAGTVEVVATTSILGDIAANVVGAAGTVEVIVPRGVDPHGFEPSVGAAGRLHGADLVVANGLGLEAAMHDVLAAAEREGREVLHVAEHVDPLPLTGGDEHGEDGGHGEDAGHGGEGDEHGELDPHFWHDPLRVARAAEAIAERLAQVAPEVAGTVRDNAAAYGAELEQLDGDIEALLGAIPASRRHLVTTHGAFNYLAARYDLEVIGTIVPGGTTLAEASTAQLAALAERIRAEDVPAVFTENVGSARLAEALSREVGGVRVVGLYSDALAEPGSEADTLVALLHANARRIADALGGSTGG